ncbi:hypothetical protein EHEL_051060 [Encephalitozoon hellem ATCC 50504]|uniref:uncharacterized protein n=1 Tax=Encephalitozoon hellem (strain ATCC 50504) TaxID=907965 RepID=UPI000269D7B8|nr:uncharacterized protein EHEL_051060 [Encephalitozoon hellem ATCC 50504]AFM98315.1 hypothetical protein EHEL_051060 [Encephalitozoon hellem ATCC 50504]|eukprot:XP_003887296.1 hypothetical protein EHEL_051060 [Encephalitozoon hellem ATCC 50504]
MSIVYEAVGMRRCARTGADFDKDLRRFSILEKVVVLIVYILPIAAPSAAKFVDASYNLFFPLSMGLSVSSFMPISARVAKRFFDQDTVRIITPHSLIVAAYTAVVFVFSLRMSSICYSNGFLEPSGPHGETMYRMLILTSYMFYESGRLINRSMGLYKMSVVISQLISAFLIILMAMACEMGLASHSHLIQLFFTHGVSSIVMSLAFDSFPSMVALKKNLDVFPILVAAGYLVAAILCVEIVLPRYNINK